MRAPSPSFEDLADGPCPACGPGTEALSDEGAARLAGALGHGWTMDGKRLVKQFDFPDFAGALAFVDRIGAMSEDVGHHPDIHLGWGKAKLEIWTHVANGLTLTDFAWAARAERLAG
jgi:4a-hydroxytetrahydrobiopterin dehydratase